MADETPTARPRHAHNPWSMYCGRRADGEPYRDGERCPTCEPDATEADTLRADDWMGQAMKEGYPVVCQQREEARAALADRDATIARVEALCDDYELIEADDLRAALSPETHDVTP